MSGVQVDAPAESATPEVGSLVTLDGRREDRKLVGKTLLASFHPSRGGLALLRGPVGVIGADGTWQVGLVPLAVPAEAVIRGEPGEGSRVFIWANRDDEGDLRAVYVNVLQTD